MPAAIKSGYKLPQDHYAYIYGVHVNTIHRWQARRLPLDDPSRLIGYLARQPHCPAAVKRKGTAAILADYATLARE